MKVKKMLKTLYYKETGIPVRNKEDALDVIRLADYYGVEAVYRISYFGKKADREARAVWVRGKKRDMEHFDKALTLLRRWSDYMDK